MHTSTIWVNTNIAQSRVPVFTVLDLLTGLPFCAEMMPNMRDGTVLVVTHIAPLCNFAQKHAPRRQELSQCYLVG